MAFVAHWGSLRTMGGTFRILFIVFRTVSRRCEVNRHEVLLTVIFGAFVVCWAVQLCRRRPPEIRR